MQATLEKAMDTSKENQTRKGSGAKQSALNRLLMEGAEAWRLRPSVVALIVLLPAFIGEELAC